jgi:hypothetical protein
MISLTPRADKIALRLTGKTGLFCDGESLAQYNDLLHLARELERHLEAERSATAKLQEMLRLAFEAHPNLDLDIEAAKKR